MINFDIVIIDGKPYRKIYSDKYYIQKVGTDEIYSIAYDVMENNFDYIETEKGLEKIWDFIEEKLRKV